MDNARDVGVLLEDALQGILVATVSLFKGGTYARNLLYSVNNISIGIGEIVNNNYFVACLLQFYGGVTSNKTSTTSNENCLFHSCFVYLYKKPTGVIQ